MKQYVFNDFTEGVFRQNSIGQEKEIKGYIYL